MTAGFDYTKFAVLFVDDEEQTCKYFRMAFEGQFTVVVATGAEEAFSALSSGTPPVGIVVTDQRMPRQTGTELLARVRRANPDIIRILTTAYSDLDAVIEAVNTGAIYKYVVKPWDVRELRVLLMRAMEYFLLRRERDALVTEKLGVLQQVLLADRVRSLAILAQGLSTHVRDTMIALQAYVDLASEQLGAANPELAAKGAPYFSNLRTEMEDANHHMLRIIHSIAEATLDRRYEFGDRLRLGDLVRAAWAGALPFLSAEVADPVVDVAPDWPELACVRPMLERMFAHLFRHIASGGSDGRGPVQIIARETASVFGAESAVVDIVGTGFAWGEQSLSTLLLPSWVRDDDGDAPDLLAAFFIAYHHGGTLVLHRRDDQTAGFRLTLPFSPEDVKRPELDADAVSALFARLPRLDALEREPF
jgi:two-component system probable response regulator PhcQ